MASFTKFEEIEAWKTAEAIVVLAYGLLKEGPGSKDWALKDQMQRLRFDYVQHLRGIRESV